MSFCMMSTPSLWLQSLQERLEQLDEIRLFVLLGFQRHPGHTFFVWLGQMKALHLWHCCCVVLSSFELHNKHRFLLSVPLVLVTWSGGACCFRLWPPDPSRLLFPCTVSRFPCSLLQCSWWPSLLCGTGSLAITSVVRRLIWSRISCSLMLWMKAARPFFVERGWS